MSIRKKRTLNLLDHYNYVDTKIATEVTRRTLVLILAGGEGSRLGELTKWRAKPAVPFGGKYRMIDFPLSNCVNSGLRRIGVLTQYKAHSLIQHIQRGWGFLRGEFGEFVELLPAQQRIDETSWYKGTADAVYQNLDIIRHHAPDFVLILAGDHIYKMDYGPMLALHVEGKADVTVGSVEVPCERAHEFGVLTVNERNEVIRFMEKPQTPETLPGRPPAPQEPGRSHASSRWKSRTDRSPGRAGPAAQDRSPEPRPP